MAKSLCSRPVLIMCAWFFIRTAWLYLPAQIADLLMMHSPIIVFVMVLMSFFPSSVRYVPDLADCTIFWAFMCKIRVLTAPSPMWSCLQKVERLTNLFVCNNCNALKTCGMLNVNILLDPFRETILCSIWTSFFRSTLDIIWYLNWIIYPSV